MSMKLNKDSSKLSGQKIKDYMLLYKLFGDQYFYNTANTTEKGMRKLISDVVDNSGKYLMLSNIKQDDSHTRYCTLIIIEDREPTLNKIWSILRELGEIEWMDSHDFGVDIQIKDGFLLTLLDYTNGVI